VRDSLLTRPKILAQELGIKQRQQSYLDSLEQKVSQTQDSLVLRNRLARSYALRGEFAKAEEHLRAVMAMDSTNFVAYNNLGNVYFLQGELDSAEASYFKALPLARTFDDSMGIHLNLGALFYAADSVEVAEEMFAEVIEDSSDLARVELLLGINLGDVDLSKTGKQQLKQISAASVKSLALKAVDSKKGKKKSDGKKKKDGKKRTKAGARKGRRPSTEIANVFYWAR
jgi:tetratricopeptide (TPR) repeat protein